MPLSRTPTETSFPVWSSRDYPDQNTERWEPIPTAENIKNTALFGIPLTSSLTQQTLSDDAITQYIKEAISKIEHEFDLYITPVMIEERMDYEREMWMYSYAYMRLNHPNVLEVWNVQLSFINNSVPQGVDRFS